jgi:hypothetical protein
MPGAGHLTDALHMLAHGDVPAPLSMPAVPPMPNATTRAQCLLCTPGHFSVEPEALGGACKVRPAEILNLLRPTMLKRRQTATPPPHTLFQH